MDELRQALEAVVQAGPQRIMLSGPRAGAACRRARLRPLDGGGWQVERFTDTQAFHQNISGDALTETLAALLTDEFTQLTATTESREYSVKLSKRGKVLRTSRALPNSAALKDEIEDGTPAPAHNRTKSRLLPEGADIPPLVEMGVFTPEGRVAAGMGDKYRQICRFAELVEDALPKQPPQSLRVVDFGCGKSYLTFILYYYLTQMRGIQVQMTGLDLKADVVASCNNAAQKHGYTGLHFEVGDIAAYDPAQDKIDMVVTLHACDTATDLALAKAVGWDAGIILSVPCCQHELRGQMHSEELAILTRYGTVKERTAALMTDALRANLLVACGYKAQLLEFVEMAHTPKNIMIRAVKTGQPATQRKRALDEATRLCAAFGFEPSLLTLLRENGWL